MSDYAFNYSFNITGNASTAAQQITGDVTALNNTVKQASGLWDSFAGKVVAFNQLSQFVEGFSRTVDETLAPGARPQCLARRLVGNFGRDGREPTDDRAIRA